MADNLESFISLKNWNDVSCQYKVFQYKQLLTICDGAICNAFHTSQFFTFWYKRKIEKKKFLILIYSKYNHWFNYLHIFY